MAEEIINITVVDPTVDVTLAKLRAAKTEHRNLKQMTLLGKELKEHKGLLDRLPAITRAQRLAITQIPMTRQALAMSYRLKMLAAATPLVASAAIVVYMIKMAEQMERMQRQMVRDRGRYEDMVRDGMDLTHEEWEMLSREQKGWATEWDAFMEKSKDDWFAAAEDFMRGLYVKYTVAPEPGSGISTSDVSEEDVG